MKNVDQLILEYIKSRTKDEPTEERYQTNHDLCIQQAQVCSYYLKSNTKQLKCHILGQLKTSLDGITLFLNMDALLFLT